MLAATIGASAGLLLLVLTRDQTPHVGDNIHHLPHGGTYRDGNKAICYQGPRRRSSNGSSGEFWALLAIFVLTMAIMLSQRLGRTTRCIVCTTAHAPNSGVSN